MQVASERYTGQRVRPDRGCFQGFQAFGSAEGVGRQTTISVVQAIFLVIVIDALFSVMFNHLGI